ncbi:MAG: DUF11 domain-containing protein [Myxococcales bacterium]|nr:DUF11 domain-containing protein [Myxococcales bacterium]
MKSAPAQVEQSDLTFTIDYKNEGPTPALAAVLRDPLPLGSTFVEASMGGVLEGDEVRWDLGNLGVGEGGQVTFTVQLGDMGQYANVASLDYHVGLNEFTADSNETLTLFGVGNSTGGSDSNTSGATSAGTGASGSGLGERRRVDRRLGERDRRRVDRRLGERERRLGDQRRRRERGGGLRLPQRRARGARPLRRPRPRRPLLLRRAADAPARSPPSEPGGPPEVVGPPLRGPHHLLEARALTRIRWTHAPSQRLAPHRRPHPLGRLRRRLARDRGSASASGATIGTITVSGSASASASASASGTDGGTDSDGTSAGTEGSASSASGASDTIPGPKFDLGEVPDGGIFPEDEGCKNVDLLFVIDNSGSMEDEQVNLINSFPGFVNAMQMQLDSAESYHVGVTTSDVNAYNACSGFGSLVTRTGGANSSNATCTPYASGKAFMNEADDLGQKFPVRRQGRHRRRRQ